MGNSINIQLLDAAESVTGSKYLIQTKDKKIEGLSAHADQKGLINWMNQLKKKPGKIFIVHGEPESADALRVKIKDVYGWDCEIPTLNEIVKIN